MKIITTLLTVLIAFSISAQTIDTDYSNHKKRAIKFEFFSPLTGNSTFGYENYIKDWLSWEAKVGFIGLGLDNNDINPSGFLFKGGPKFKLNPDFVTDDLKGSHLLSGKYIRPELIFAHYTQDEPYYNGTSEFNRETFTSVGFLITYGRQYILANIMTLDYHIGLGYGWDNSNDGRYNYGHSNGDTSFPVAISAGFTIGVLMK
ncbi:Protein of unknown function [Ekhidna lutea]|uniref:DUF3575 domain-containing protein n=1 Tax=Ekhidna lutea TaxID=447679 RepID=A0A239KEN7_EKHLU|nr:DUF3575 domain-containing protein [Ekhidna lutea]SNT16827.1 Protein of unknown function [Ekhidna lutea]